MSSFSKKDILRLEKKFDEQDFDNKESFGILKGNIPIIVSAPHSVTQTRLGELKQSECITGVIAKILHNETNCYAIYKTKNDNDDANFDEVHPYKESLKKLIKEKKIKYILDIHVMAPHREHLIDIGTAFGENLVHNKELASLMVSIFSKNIEGVEIDKYFHATRITTISSTISRESQIDALQIELNWRIVDVKNNFEYFQRVINNFIEMIKILEKQ